MHIFKNETWVFFFPLLCQLRLNYCFSAYSATGCSQNYFCLQTRLFWLLGGLELLRFSEGLLRAFRCLSFNFQMTLEIQYIVGGVLPFSSNGWKQKAEFVECMLSNQRKKRTQYLLFDRNFRLSQCRLCGTQPIFFLLNPEANCLNAQMKAGQISQGTTIPAFSGIWGHK